jgi:hypothetical protein
VKGKKQYKSKVLLKFANLVLKITPGIGFWYTQILFFYLGRGVRYKLWLTKFSFKLWFHVLADSKYNFLVSDRISYFRSYYTSVLTAYFLPSATCSFTNNVNHQSVIGYIACYHAWDGTSMPAMLCSESFNGNDHSQTGLWIWGCCWDSHNK